MKPSALECRAIRKTTINEYSIVQLEIDLRHINYGQDSSQTYRVQARSHFTAEDIMDVFESMDGCEIDSISNNGYLYFVAQRKFFCDKRLFKIVFCIDHSTPSVAGIITFYRLK